MTDTRSQEINLDNTDDDIPLAAMTVRNDKDAVVETPEVRKGRTRENEKFRKKKINENIDRFLEIVPNDQKIKWSKNQILERTFEYIAELQDKCRRYHTMDAESIQQEKISELLTENDRFRKENECFLEIFRTLNIQPNGLLEMNHQLKNAAKKDEKLAAQGLLSPTQQTSFSQSMNVLLSPPGQYSSDPSGMVNHSGPGLLSPTIVNGSLVLPQRHQQVRDAAGLSSLNSACSSLGGMPKKEPVKNELEGHQDMDKVFQELMDETDTVQPLLKTPDRGTNTTMDDNMKNPVNTSSVAMTTSSQVFVDVSTHQPSVTANEGHPKLTSAATTPATMVTQSVSGPITTTAGSTLITNAGQNFVPGQATTSMSSGLRVTPSIQGAVVSSAQPNILFQQQGQTLLLSLPGRPGLIPVKIAPPPPKQQPPVILPNQGHCGNLAKQLSVTPQKRRPIKIKEQGAMPPTIGLGGTSTPQTMTVRLGAPGGNGVSSGMVLNSGGMMVQQTMQQPVVINTPGGGQQTVLMQMPVQFQQPIVQPQQQVVYIQQNGQLIPVVVNQSATHQQQQQVVPNPVIVNSSNPIQGQQGPLAMSNQQPSTSSVNGTPPLIQPNTTAASQPVFSQSSQAFMAGQASQSSNVSSPHVSGSQSVNGNGQIGGPQGFIPSDPGKDAMQGMQLSNSVQQVHMGGVDHEQLNDAGMSSRVGEYPQGEENTDDILAQAAEHIFTQSGGDAPLQGNHLGGGGGLEGSSTQDEGSSSHGSKHKKKKKKKEKERREKEKRKKKEKEKEKKRKNRAAAAVAQHTEAAQVATVSRECDTNGKSGQEFLESFLQDSDDQRGGDDQLSGTPPISGENDLGGVGVPRPGDILQGYPPTTQIGTTPTSSQHDPAVSTSVVGDPTEGNGTDILSNSMNFIGLPTLDEEEGVENGEEDRMLVGQGTGSVPIPRMDPPDEDDDDDDDDDDDPEAHVFSPPCTPETTEDQSKQQQLPADGVPETMPPETYPEEAPEPEDKSPPPPYPVSLQATLQPDTVPGGAVSRPFDILSQPWVTQTVTPSSPPGEVKVTSVPSQRAADIMEGAHAAASSQAMYPYGNFSNNFSSGSFTSGNESLQQFSAITTRSNFPTSQAPGTSSTYSSHVKPRITPESTGVKPPNFNFYSSTPFSKHLPQDLTTRDPSLRVMTENNTGMTSQSGTTFSPTSSIMSTAMTSASSSSSQRSGATNPQQFSMPSRVSPPSPFGISPPLQKSARENPTPEGSMQRTGSLLPGTFSSGPTPLRQPLLGNPTSVTLPQGNFPLPLSLKVSSGAIPSVVPPPQRHQATPMRALEKPPKSFTKANIHRTLTSFDKEQEDKWAEERERLAKEARKPPPVVGKDVTKPSPANLEPEDDSVGHRALDRDLVNKFPWLADEEEEEEESPGKKSNLGKQSSRNPTPFSVQSMAQSSAAQMSAAQRPVSRKGQQGKPKAPPISTKGRGVSKKQNPPLQHQVTPGSSLNLWNPSFSKGDQKSQSLASTSSSSDDVTIIEDDDQPPPPPPRTLKNIILNQQSLATADSTEHPKGRRKTGVQTAQPNQGRSSSQVSSTSNSKSSNQSAVAQSALENVLRGPLSSSMSSSLPPSLPPYSTSQSQQQTSNVMNVSPFSQFTTSGLFSESQNQNAAPKVPSQSSHPKAPPPPMVNPTMPTTSQEQDHSSDLFQSSLDFLFDKTDQASDLTDNMGTSLPGHQELNSLPPLSKQSSMPAMRNTNFEQSITSSLYGQPSPANQTLSRQQSPMNQPLGRQQSPMNQPLGRLQSPMNQPIGRQQQQQPSPVNQPLGRQQQHQQSPVHHQSVGRHQMSQGMQRMTSSPAPASRSVPPQPATSGGKRHAAQQPAASKRQQKEGDIFRGSPALSDSSHLGSPDTGSYGSPMMPGDLQSSTERYRYQQSMLGYPGQSNVSANIQTNYQQGSGGAQKKPNLSMEAAEVKRSKGVHSQMRNPTDEWPSQSPHASQGSRGIPRHGERGSQNPASFVSEMTSPTVASSSYSQSDLAGTPGNSSLLSSLSPTRHLRPNELPTYLPSIQVRNPILTSPSYPGKTSSTREPEINFESMFPSTRPNTLPLNVPHNYTMFPDHHPPPPHNSGLSTVKHGHVAGHMGNSSASPFNFSNIFNDPPSSVSGSQVHPSQGASLNHGLHPAMHLGNNPADDGTLRGGVNQRHRNQQLASAPGMRLDHLFNPNPMGVPPHPFVPGMPPF